MRDVASASLNLRVYSGNPISVAALLIKNLVFTNQNFWAGGVSRLRVGPRPMWMESYRFTEVDISHSRFSHHPEKSVGFKVQTCMDFAA